MIPSAHMLEYGNNYIFQDDNAPCHRSIMVRVESSYFNYLNLIGFEPPLLLLFVDIQMFLVMQNIDNIFNSVVRCQINC